MKRIVGLLVPLVLIAGFAWGANKHILASWPENADSAKLFIYSQDATTIVDSSAGAARTGGAVRNYDTLISLNLDDSTYHVKIEIWYPGADTSAPWIWPYGSGDVKIMLAANRDVATGYLGAWFGTVNDAAPTTLAFVAAGAGTVSPFDLSRSDDFYNDGRIVFVSGNLKGKSAPITDWKTSPDSLINRGFFAAPTNGDTFMVTAQAFPDMYAISGDIGAADSLEAGLDGYGDAQLTNREMIASVSGSGSNSDSVIAYDTTNGFIIPNMTITMRNLAQTSNVLARVTTDQNGAAVILLNDSGTITAAQSGFTAILDTINNKPGPDTLFFTSFNPGTPADNSFSRVYGFIKESDSTAVQGAIVTATLRGSNLRDTIAGVWVSTSVRQTITDSVGYFALDIRKTQFISPSTAYNIEAKLGGRRIFYIPGVTIGDVDSVEVLP